MTTTWSASDVADALAARVDGEYDDEWDVKWQAFATYDMVTVTLVNPDRNKRQQFWFQVKEDN